MEKTNIKKKRKELVVPKPPVIHSGTTPLSVANSSQIKSSNRLTVGQWAFVFLIAACILLLYLVVTGGFVHVRESSANKKVSVYGENGELSEISCADICGSHNYVTIGVAHGVETHRNPVCFCVESIAYEKKTENKIWTFTI